MLSFSEFLCLYEEKADVEKERERLKKVLEDTIEKTQSLKDFGAEVKFGSYSNKPYCLIIDVALGHNGRVEYLTNVYEAIKTKEKVINNLKQKNWHIKVGQVYIYCKSSHKVGSSFTLKDYIGSYGVKENMELPNLKEGEKIECYVFSNAQKMRRYIEEQVRNNPKFSEVQKHVVTALFDMQGEGKKRGNVIKQLKENPQILISFGELLIPWLYLKGKYELKISGVDNKRYANLSKLKKRLYFPVSSNNATIDCAISYGDPKKGECVVFSAKYGSGHGKSVMTAIKNIPNLNDETLKKVQGNLVKFKTSIDALWESFLPTVTVGNKTITPSGLYRELPQGEPSENLALFEKEASDGLKQKVEAYREKCEQDVFPQYTGNIELIKKNFPYSLSYLCYNILMNHIQNDKDCLDEFKRAVLGGDYYQYRINEGKAKQGIFDFSFSAISKTEERTLTFAIGCSSRDISSKYGLGYKIS